MYADDNGHLAEIIASRKAGFDRFCRENPIFADQRTRDQRLSGLRAGAEMNRVCKFGVVLLLIHAVAASLDSIAAFDELKKLQGKWSIQSAGKNTSVPNDI